ncbi:hypothetical protein B0H11DRAFT_2298145 [Mycena galericulata]|nr:hypothetical protein B0H11DRAFT_2298145 [Mycena galericulata]
MLPNNNQTSSHYREHTRQQDGWTVLAPPPDPQPTGELPPPYTPEAAPAAPAATAAVVTASLWAKEISVGHATAKRPPENIMFQEYFLHERKKTRTMRSESSSTNPCAAAPTIHVTVNTGTSHNVRYPPVTDILQLIDDSGIFEGSAELTFPAIIFADDLLELEITRVNRVPLLNTEFYVDQIHMPVALAQLFVDESIAAMGRAQKGKGAA